MSLIATFGWVKSRDSRFTCYVNITPSAASSTASGCVGEMRAEPRREQNCDASCALTARITTLQPLG